METLMKFEFGKNNPYWMPDKYSNYTWLRLQEGYILDIIRHKGYIYLNRIYELLGIEWNPDSPNRCIKRDEMLDLTFRLVGMAEDGSFTIEVIYSQK